MSDNNSFFKKLMTKLHLSRQENGNGSGLTLKEALSELIQEDDNPEALIRPVEAALFSNMLKLRDLRVSDIMIPHADIVAVEVDTPFNELVELIIEKAHSRLPVYRKTLDDVLGMVHIKDVLAHSHDKAAPTVRQLLRDVIFVSPAMRAMDLLLQMQNERIHQALVVDEWGGVDGLITIEDLVEQIVGQIQDEHDIDPDHFLVERPDGVWLADARTPLKDFEEKVGPIATPEEQEEIDTLGGLVFRIAGRVPDRGEVLRHENSGYEFEVIEGDARQVHRLRIRPKADKGEESA